VVEQLSDLFCTTHTFKTEHVTKIRGRYCGDIELTAYLANASDPVSSVLDLFIAHDRFGSTSDPSLNGHLHYPNDIDKSLNETISDKNRRYRSDYDKKKPTSVSCIPTVASTPRKLLGEVVRLLFLKAHRETDLFFATSGVHLAKHYRGLFHFLLSVFFEQLKNRVGLSLTKSATYVSRLI
jgi:hypothetical protein